MLEELKNMYEVLIKYIENKDLTCYQRELAKEAKNSVRLLIAMED